MGKRTQYWRDYYHRNRERILARQQRKRRERDVKPPGKLSRSTYMKKLMANGVRRKEALRLTELAERRRLLRGRADQFHD